MQNYNLSSPDFIDQLMAMQDLVYRMQQQQRQRQLAMSQNQTGSQPKTKPLFNQDSESGQLGGIAQNFGMSTAKSGGAWQVPAVIAASQLFKMNSDHLAQGKGNHGWFKTIYDEGIDEMFGKKGMYGLIKGHFD
jgi:hypothetical protein